MTTSDGIPLSEWSKIHDIAIKHANGVMQERVGEAELQRNRMLAQLRVLERKFGRRPSILATRADFTVRLSLKVALLKEAFMVASRMRDHKNVTFIASSLAQILAEIPERRSEAIVWTRKLSDALNRYSDPSETRQLKELERQMRQ